MSENQEAGSAASRLPLLVRGVEVLLGAVFLLAAVLKLMDPNLFVAQIHLYKIFSDPAALGGIAVFTLLLETAMGVAMLLGVRLGGAMPAAVFGMLLFFTCLIAYAWPEDCGCFGSVKMGPEVSIAKNLVMMLAVAFIYFGSRRSPQQTFSLLPLRAAISVLAGIAAGVYTYPQVFQETTKAQPVVAEVQTPKDPAAKPETPTATTTEPAQEAATPAAPAPPVPAATGPYSGYVIETEYGETFNLSSGDYLVASLSMTCEHCMASVPTLNDLSMDPSLPRLVCIAFEQDAGDKENFLAQTQAMFPIHSIGNNFLEFSRIMADAPPRLALVRNGSALMTWDKEFPPLEELRTAISGAIATGAAGS